MKPYSYTEWLKNELSGYEQSLEQLKRRAKTIPVIKQIAYVNGKIDMLKACIEIRSII